MKNFIKFKLIFLIVFSFFFIENQGTKLDFFHKKKKFSPETSSNNIGNDQKILENSQVSLTFNHNSDNSTVFVKNSDISHGKNTNKSQNTVVFQPMTYKTYGKVSKSYEINPEDNLITAENNDNLATNDSDFQQYYSNYFRNYYENLQNVYSPSNNEENQGTLLQNPNINHFYHPFRNKRRDLSPFSTIVPYQRMPIKRNNGCPCSEHRSSFCDCDEIDGNNDKILQMPAIIMPIIQPVIKEIPNGKKCVEEEEDCLCGRRKYLERKACKCGCEGRVEKREDYEGNERDDGLNSERNYEQGTFRRNYDGNDRNYDRIDRNYDGNDESRYNGDFQRKNRRNTRRNYGNYERNDEEDDYNENNDRNSYERNSDGNDADYDEIYDENSRRRPEERRRSSERGNYDENRDYGRKYEKGKENSRKNNNKNCSSKEKININNANANNANLLAQKNTLNKIDNVYATNYSATNYNHHIHNYIQAADFKFLQENLEKTQEKLNFPLKTDKNTTNQRKNFLRKSMRFQENDQNDKNCVKKPKKVFYPPIEITDEFSSKSLLPDQEVQIMTKIPKEVVNSVITSSQYKELDEEIKERENYTGIMNQAIENTIKNLKNRRKIKKMQEKSKK